MVTLWDLTGGIIVFVITFLSEEMHDHLNHTTGYEIKETKV